MADGERIELPSAYAVAGVQNRSLAARPTVHKLAAGAPFGASPVDPPAGLEPASSRLEGGCPFHLGHGGKMDQHERIGPSLSPWEGDALPLRECWIGAAGRNRTADASLFTAALYR